MNRVEKLREMQNTLELLVKNHGYDDYRSVTLEAFRNIEELILVELEKEAN